MDPRKPWNGRSTTIVNVDTHERHEWTDTEDNASVKVKKTPFYQNRAVSNPNLPKQDEPFNYIAFSQQLYGEKPTLNNVSERPSKPRTVSYV